MPSTPEIQPWAEKLETLLQKAIAAKESLDAERVAAVQRELRKFRNDSPDYADVLDTQANLAIFDLDLSVAEAAVDQLKQRAQAIYGIKKLITGIADEAEANAGVLRGKFAVDAIDAATEAVNAFKRLRDKLSTTKADEKAVAAEIKAAIEAVQSLRTKLDLS